MTTSPKWVTGEALRPYLRGAPFVDFPEGRARIHRLDPAVRSYPLDAWEHARTSAGVRVEFQCSAPEVRVRLRYVEIRSQPKATLWHAGKPMGAFDPQGKAGEHEIAFAVPLAAAAPSAAPLNNSACTLYLPYNSVVEVAGIAPATALQPTPPAAKRWLAFGDSITHGNNATDPGMTYPAIVARQLGIDFWNLGFAGAARGEPAVAETVSALPADIISFAFGTNLMRYGQWYDRNSWREAFRNFLTIIRNGHPDIPILVITPIYRSAANAETTANARGTNLADIRDVEDKVVTAKRFAGDMTLQVLPGLQVLGASNASLLGDGIHPGDAGMELMARAIAPRLAALLAPPP